MPHVVVIGAGISGLAAAHRLSRESHVDITVLEASDRVGGLIDTERVDDFVIEIGPESIITDKPWAVELAREVGLADQIIGVRKEGRGAFIVHNGKLERVPEGFNLLAPTQLWSFATTPILSMRGKLRAALDLILPRSKEDQDESLASFVERRLGREVLERLAQPLVGGIYGADPTTLSLRATMPRFLDAERDHRSVIAGLRARAKTLSEQEASGARYGLFINFKEGMRAFPEAVARGLGERVALREKVLSLETTARGVEIRTDSRSLQADAVVLALSARAQSRLLASTDASLAQELAEIPYGDAGIVTFAWRREHVPHPMNAFGFVVPTIEQRPILASTFLSQKWEGRAPADWLLLRVFIGGPHGQSLLHGPIDDMIRVAREQMKSLIGVEHAPELVRAHRWYGAMPQYVLGHLERVARIDVCLAQHSRISLAGNSLRGVGIADAVRVGFEAAARALRAV